MYQKIEDKMQKLERALNRLEFMISKGIDKDRAYVDSSIQRFEIVFELVWKTLKAFLEYEGKETAYPRQAFELAYQGKLIGEEAVWLQMMKDRNETSHIYDESRADEIYQNITNYIHILKELFDKLKVLQIKINK
jgi:nucleotidyltransferase substrate binding protein (TIGR01987 family)